MAAVVATVEAETRHLEAASTMIIPGALSPVSRRSPAAAAAAAEDDNNIPAAAAGGPVGSAAVDAPAAVDGPITSPSVVESDSEARNNHSLLSSSSGPSIWQLLAALLGLTATISLVLFTAGLANGQGLQPSWATIFAWSLTFMVVVIKGIQSQSAANNIDQATPGQGGVPRVLDKAARQALLTYFVFGPPKEEQRRSGDDDRDAEERDEEGGNCVGERERTSDVVGRHNTARVSSTPPVSLSAAVPVVSAGAPTTAAHKLWLEMENDRESRGLASEATETFAVTGSTDGRERPSSDDQKPGGASALHTGEGARACNERPRGPTHPDIEKGSSEWSTTGTCIVCFGEYSHGDRLCRMPCGHTYHAVCIDEWLDRAGQPCCPLCKKDLWEELPGAGTAATGVSEAPAAGNAGMEAV